MRMNFKRPVLSLFLLLIISIMLSLSACSANIEKKAPPKETASVIQIGMSFDSFVIERWTRDKEVFVSTAAKLGADVNVQNANGDLETQKKQIRYFIKKRVDAIVIIAVDSDNLFDVVDEAKDSGIKVIAYDRMINNANIDLYISFDNERVGVLMAQALIKSSGFNGRYLMLCGPTTDDNVKKVVHGFNVTIADKGIAIADSMNAESWKAELAYDYLDLKPEIINDIDGIMCGNDNMATQAVKFLSEHGMAGKVPVVGQDADLEACQRIVEGTQAMTVYKPVEQLASKAAEYAVFLANGKEISSNCEFIPNGEYKCPYVSLEPVAVNRSNMDEIIINGGFHLKEEVYLNVKQN